MELVLSEIPQVSMAEQVAIEAVSKVNSSTDAP
jgi:hypothetical protein